MDSSRVERAPRQRTERQRTFRVFPRVLAVSLLIGFTSCYADSPTQPGAEAWLVVSPDSVVFASFGEEAQLEAAFSPQGPAMRDASAVVWASTDTSVVTVTSDGVARAVGNGVAGVTASRSGQFGLVVVEVSQVPVFMTLPTDTVVLPGPGASERIDAAVLDAGGSVLQGAEPSIYWSSGDETVATVDDSGVVSAVGSGETAITAEAVGTNGGLRHEVAVTVDRAIRVDDSGATLVAPNAPARLELGPGAVTGTVFMRFQAPGDLPIAPTPIAGTAVEITPVGTRFERPATLSIEYDEGELPEGVGEDQVALHQLVGNDWVEVANGAVDAAANTVSGQIEGLGIFAVVRRLAIAMPPMDSAVVGVEYSIGPLGVVGGSGANRWTLSAGSGPPPPGLTLFPDGTVQGIPSEEGSWTFVVDVISGGQTAQGALTIVVDPPLDIATTAMPDAAPSVTYSSSLDAIGGSGVYAWSVASGSGPLPPGLDLSENGFVTGTPTESGSWSFVAQVRSRGQVEQETLSITVMPHLVLSTGGLADGVVGRPYSASLSATGGDGSYVWTLASGSAPLPPGLDLSGAGAISGVPTSEGDWTFEVEVSSGDGQSSRRALSIVVHDPLAIETAGLSGGAPTVPYLETLDASGGGGGYVWRLATGSGPLPTGLSLSADGSISGAPTVEGTWTFTVEVESEDGQTAQRALSITVLATLQVSTSALPNGAPGVAFSAALEATGGDGTYSWQLASGSTPLPPGLGLAADGTISGSPTQDGTWAFTVRVNSGDGQQAQRQLSITIQAPTAAFTVSCTDLTCNFTDESSDDGSVVAWSWAFGEGGVSNQRHPTYTYPTGGTYTITLVVTDDLGATSTPVQRQVTLSTPPVLVGAGDIATCGGAGDEATAALLDGLPGTVFTAGDNAYPNGTAADFMNCYDPSWGRHKSRTRPSTGNHDYDTPAASAYFDYFGARAGDPSKGYYSYDLGAWHIVVLNSNLQTTAGSAQLQWLAADLAANPRTCTLAYWHHARFSSGPHGSNAAMKPFWDVLYAAGADVVVVGHDHVYERFAPQNPSGVADPVNGIRQFVVGTGGTTLRPFSTIAANSEVRNSSTWGVLELTLYSSRYEWRFVPTTGSGFSDTGSTSCH